MNVNRIQQCSSWLSACIVSIGLLLAGCGGSSEGGEGPSGSVELDGSSTTYPVSEAVAEEFMRAHPGTRVTVGVSGTGGGFSKFLRGETDINDASRPITRGERETAEQNGISFIELPTAYDGIAVVAHPENDWVECLSVEELRQIWNPDSEVQQWSDIRESFPDRPIELYGPGTASGTYDYFTEAIVGESGASRADFTASEDDNVLVQGIEGTPNALGYFGHAYYENNAQQLKLIGIDPDSIDGGAECVEPTEEAIQSGTYQPLSRPLFIYVNADRMDDEAVRTFVDFYLNNAGSLAKDVGYVALSDSAYALAQARFTNGITGTAFGQDGIQAGTRVEQVLRQSMPDSISIGTPSADTARTASAGAPSAQ